ncbi:MAG TPA: ATP synthase F0 subunit B [Candidatus Sulfotelmatobacter sp.]|nr:ATP synthase F0 subunit B [Candidatus Sulfotelmatobacter sp.]
MKRPLSTILHGLLASSLMLTLAAASQAAQEGATPAEQTLAGTIFKWIHFLIVVALAYWVFAKLLPPYARHNADRISAAISKSTAAKAEAERQLKEAVEKLSRLEQEVMQFREQAKKDAAAEWDRLRHMTQADVHKVGIAAKAEIDAAERAARVELKALAAKLAVDRAESLITGRLTPTLQESMFNNFVHSLQETPN